MRYIDWGLYVAEQFVLMILTMFVLAYVSGKLARQGLDICVDYYLGDVDLLEVERIVLNCVDWLRDRIKPTPNFY